MLHIQTNKMRKICSKCDEEKPVELFSSPHNRICKVCRNENSREKYKNHVIDAEKTRACVFCNGIKPMTEFLYRTYRCKDCNNNLRREKYEEDEATKERIRAEAREFKRKKTEERQKVRAEEKAKLEAEIGEDNTICKYCKEIVPKSHFRHNRLKCKDCERDEPSGKFRRLIRTRIWWCLEKKVMHTIEYLGCTFPEYEKWMTEYSPEFTMENRGSVWHIDHVIPISKFNLDDPAQQLIAFNWRNTAPLLARENLAKNHRIIPSQIEQHLAKLEEYNTTNDIEFPLVFSNLFAKHLDAGSPLESSLPLHSGNSLEELGYLPNPMVIT